MVEIRPSIPKNTILLSDLVEMVVEANHGQAAIADIDGVTHDGEITSFKEGDKTFQQRAAYVIRAGTKFLKTEDDARWDDAREMIRLALSLGKIQACLKIDNEDDEHILRDFWLDEVPASLTIHMGVYRAPPNLDVKHLIYVQKDEAQKWISGLKSSGENDQPKNVGGRRPKYNYDAFEKTLIKEGNLQGKNWISRQFNINLAKKTTIWMKNDPDISADDVPSLGSAEKHVSKMRRDAVIPAKSNGPLQ